MAIVHLNKEDFIKKVANLNSTPDNLKFIGKRPALIDFYAEWCGPCKMLAPVLEEISGEFAEKIDVYKVNVDDENELSAHFGIRSIPTLIFIPVNGKTERIQGAVSKQQLKKAIENILLEQ